MTIAQIETNLQYLIKNYTRDTFFYDLLLVYGLPKATIARLKNGLSNLSKVDGEVLLKKKLFFKEVESGLLHATIDELIHGANKPKHDPRFIITAILHRFQLAIVYRL